MGVVDFVRKIVSTPKPPKSERSADVIVLEEWRKRQQRRLRIRIEAEEPQEKAADRIQLTVGGTVRVHPLSGRTHRLLHMAGSMGRTDPSALSLRHPME